MDASVATGAAAMMAIRVLLDHDVKEENILLVSLLMAAQGVHAIAYAYPKGDLIFWKIIFKFFKKSKSSPPPSTRP